MAGRPGDRWASLRKKAGREESPDTMVFAFFDETKVFVGKRLRPKGNAPGNARGLIFSCCAQAHCEGSATDSATENKPPV